MQSDLYTRVTNTIVAHLEQGVRPWHKPWHAEHMAGRISRPLRGNGVPYQGINVLMLWAASVAKGYACPIWLTYRQAQELGGQVRKGEKSEQVVYADRFRKTETDANGDEVEREIPFLKAYCVFNAEQIDGLPPHFSAMAAPQLDPVQRIGQAEAFFSSLHADIRHRGNRAFYAIEPDYIGMPPFEAFRDAESYYATLAHETAHWTRHPSRLDRDFGRKRWGDEGYALEELVAELSAAFLCADLGLTPEPRPEHADYIGSWLKALKEDRRAIFSAAAHAQRAADYLHSLQPRGTEQAA